MIDDVFFKKVLLELMLSDMCLFKKKLIELMLMII